MAADVITEDMNSPMVFTLTERDYVSANFLHARAAYKKPRSYIALLVLALLYWALMFFGGGCYCLRAAMISAAYALGGSVLVVGLCVTLGLVLLPFRSRRLFRQSKLAQSEQSVSISPDAIRFSAANYNMTQPWSDLTRWGENGRFILLYVNDRQFHILPERVLTKNERAAIYDALKKSGIPKNR